MLQLADVAGPRILLEGFQRIRRDALDLLPQLGRVPHGETERQHRNVFHPVAQRRDHDRNRGQSIVQVLPERPVVRFRGEIAVGRGHDADIHLDRGRAADALELLLLQHTQQLGLQVEPHFGNFVQQQRAAVGALEGALDPLNGAGESALFVTEQRRLHQPFGEGGAVQLDEGALAAFALVVDRAGKELLTRARLALQQDRRPGGRCHGDRLQDPTDGRRVADDLPFVAELHHFLAQQLILTAQAHKLERLLNRQLQLLRPDRLRDVVNGAGLDAGHRVLDAGVARQHDQRNVIALARQELDEFQPR